MRFVRESHLPYPPERVFALHESPGALLKLTPPWEPIELVEGGDSIRPGARVVLRMHVGPVAFRWIAEHTEYEPPHLFADRQVKGPFAAWYHRHRFLDDGRGRTLMRDEIEFEPPLGALGRLLVGSLVIHKLERTFTYRHEAVRRWLEGAS